MLFALGSSSQQGGETRLSRLLGWIIQAVADRVRGS